MIIMVLFWFFLYIFGIVFFFSYVVSIPCIRIKINLLSPSHTVVHLCILYVCCLLLCFVFYRSVKRIDSIDGIENNETDFVLNMKNTWLSENCLALFNGNTTINTEHNTVRMMTKENTLKSTNEH